MYNGIGSHTSLKGSGLSGYVQHSRAIARSNLQDAVDVNTMGVLDRITPLERMRSNKENEEMARRLEEHRRLRSIEVDVLTFAEELRTKYPDMDEATVNAQCDERRNTLLAQLKKTSTKKDGKKEGLATGKKTSKDFAIAFGVGDYKKSGSARD